MTRPTNMSQPLPALTTGFLGREAPNPITDPVDPIDRAIGREVFVPPSSGDLEPVNSDFASDGLGAAGTVPLGGTATLGNLLLFSVGVRGTNNVQAAPTGWTAHPDGTIAAGGAALATFYKTSDGTETGVFFTPNGGSGWVGGMSEWPSGLALDTSAETSGTTAPPDLSGALVTPTAGVEALIYGAMAIGEGDAAETGTPDAGWTELHDIKIGAGLNPHVYVAYRVEASASGSYTPSATVTELNPAGYGAQTLVFSGSTAPVNGGPSATDGNDATYAGPATEFLFDLGTAYRIRRAELRLAWENTGSRTVTLYGANVADFSDEVELASEMLGATGSWTAQDETVAWADAGTFRYVKLTVSVTARLHGFELYERGLSDFATSDEIEEHLSDPIDAHDASAVSYDGYESGLDATDVQAAIDELAASPGGSLELDDLTDVDTTGVADGDVLAFDSADSTWKPVAPGTPTLDYGEDGDISTLDYDDTPAGGASSEVARADHVHGMPSAGGGGGQSPWVVQVEVFLSTSNTNWDSFTAGHMHSSGAQNDELIFDGVSLDAGTWTLEGRYFRSTNHGIITVSLDGSSIGTVDLFGGALDNFRSPITGIVIASADVFQLSLKMATKNASSGGYYGLVKYLQFRRTA